MNGHRTTTATAKDVRRYFESDATVVSSPLTVFGRLTPYGRDFLKRHAVYLRGRRVLDAGAGLGVLSLEMVRAYDAFVVALDYSHWVKCIELLAHPVQADLMCLPLPERSFDTVICMEVLEHTLDPGQVLSEIWRVLRPGGALILSTPSYMNVAGILKVVLETCCTNPTPLRRSTAGSPRCSKGASLRWACGACCAGKGSACDASKVSRSSMPSSPLRTEFRVCSRTSASYVCGNR